MNNLLKEIETTVTNFFNENNTEYIEKLLNWTTKKIKIHFKKDIDSVVFKKYEIYWINF